MPRNDTWSTRAIRSLNMYGDRSLGHLPYFLCLCRYYYMYAITIIKIHMWDLLLLYTLNITWVYDKSRQSNFSIEYSYYTRITWIFTKCLYVDFEFVFIIISYINFFFYIIIIIILILYYSPHHHCSNHPSASSTFIMATKIYNKCAYTFYL